MSDTTDLLEKLVGEIAPRLTVKGDDELWSADEVGAFFKRSPGYVLQTWACLPDFPKRINLPSGKKRGQPLWVAADIKAWALKFKEAA